MTPEETLRGVAGLGGAIGDAVRDALIERDDLRAEVERLRGDVREYRRQFAGLGVAAGRGEPLAPVPNRVADVFTGGVRGPGWDLAIVTASAVPSAVAELRAMADQILAPDYCEDYERTTVNGIADLLANRADVLACFPNAETVTTFDEPDRPAAASSPVREPAPADTPEPDDDAAHEREFWKAHYEAAAQDQP